MYHSTIFKYFAKSSKTRPFINEFNKNLPNSLDRLEEYKNLLRNDLTSMFNEEANFTVDDMKTLLNQLVDIDTFKKPTIREIPEEEKTKRIELSKKAKEISVDYFVEERGRFYTLNHDYAVNGPDCIKDGKKAKVTRSRSTCAFENYIGIKYSDFSKKTEEEKKEIFLKSIREAKELTEKYSFEMSDEKFLEEMSKDARGIFFLAELQYDNPTDIAKEIGINVENDQNLINELNDFREVYSKAAVQLTTILFGKLAYISTPYYKDMSMSDAKCLKDYFDAQKVKKVADYPDLFVEKKIKNPELIDENTINLYKSMFNDSGFLAEFERTDISLEELDKYKGTGKYEKFNPFGDLIYNMEFGSSYREEKLSPGQENNILIDNGTHFIRFASRLAFNEYKKDQSVNHDNDVIEIYNVTDKKLVGDPLKMTDEEFKQVALDVTKGANMVCFINGEPVKKFDFTEAGGFLRNTGAGLELYSNKFNAKDVVSNLLNEVDSVNHHLFMPTKEFTDLVSSLEKLNKIDPNKNSKEFMEKAEEAAKHAQDYLNVKASTSKAFTAKTYKRMEAAQKVVDSLQDIKNMTSLCAELAERQKTKEANLSNEKTEIAKSNKNEIDLENLTTDKLWEQLRNSLSSNKVSESKDINNKEKTTVKEVETDNIINK